MSRNHSASGSLESVEIYELTPLDSEIPEEWKSSGDVRSENGNDSHEVCPLCRKQEGRPAVHGVDGPRRRACVCQACERLLFGGRVVFAIPLPSPPPSASTSRQAAVGRSHR